MTGGRWPLGRQFDEFTVVPELKGIPCTQVACGKLHTAALSWKGEVWTWGDNSNGATGHPSELYADFPRCMVCSGV